MGRPQPCGGDPNGVWPVTVGMSMHLAGWWMASHQVTVDYRHKRTSACKRVEGTTLTGRIFSAHPAPGGGQVNPTTGYWRLRE